MLNSQASGRYGDLTLAMRNRLRAVSVLTFDSGTTSTVLLFALPNEIQDTTALTRCETGGSGRVGRASTQHPSPSTGAGEAEEGQTCRCTREQKSVSAMTMFRRLGVEIMARQCVDSHQALHSGMVFSASSGFEIVQAGAWVMYPIPINES